MASTMAERATRLARNPHNFHCASYGGGMSAHDYAAAQFEREGRNARLGADCPYNPGTMAADRWQAGQQFRHGERLFSQGFPCPELDAAAQGWQSERAYYLEWIDRAESAWNSPARAAIEPWHERAQA